MSNNLTGETLKDALWDTLQKVKEGGMPAATGDAVAAQAREILRTVRTQVQVCQASATQLPDHVVHFATGGAD